MWLINTTTYELKEFFGTIPRYAILSHTWEDGEVSFKEFQSLPTASLKPGFAKIRRTCEQAVADQLQYCWVDTCCIDESSSAELSEAINSMYTWYQKAVICYAYLVDVKAVDQITASKWFTRGWTLQELLAPEIVVFYSAEWEYLGTKKDYYLYHAISLETGIESKYLRNKRLTWRASVAKRMSWMSKRATTRVEDMAYALLGIFEINMPLLYGEGSQSFTRLQEEIIKRSNDQTIFCWAWKPHLVPSDWQSILAPCATVFENSGHLDSHANTQYMDIKRYDITNAGLFIRVPIVRTVSTEFVLALLQVGEISSMQVQFETQLSRFQFCIVLQVDMRERIYRRYPFPEAPFQILTGAVQCEKNLLIQCGKHGMGSYWAISSTFNGRLETRFQATNFGIFLIMRYKEYIEANVGKLELSFQTDNVSYSSSESLLMFSFSGTHESKQIGVAIFTDPTLDRGRTGLCFAVRRLESENGNIEHRSYCNLLPLVPSRLEETSRQIEIDFSKHDPGVKFAEGFSSGVLLADTILHSSVNGPAKNLQLAYLAFADKRFSDVLSRFDRLAAPP